MGAVREAATVMVVRDSPDLHVFMLRRNAGMAFSPGAHVFPGGAVDEGDGDPRLATRVRGLDDEAASRALGRREGGLAVWLAAVREAYEEGDLLLAHHRDTGEPAHPDASTATVRDRLNRGESDVGELLERGDLVVHASDLLVFAHWRTPVGAPRRYDTWFFVAAAPEGQEGSPDLDETVASEWVRPGEMIERDGGGEADLIHPTRRSLEVLARYDRAAPLLRDLRSAHVASPAVVADGAGERIALPGDTASIRHDSWTIPLPDRTLADIASHHRGGSAP